MRTSARALVAASALALVLSACSGSTDGDGGETTSGSGGGSGEATTIKVAYQKTDSFFQLHDLLAEKKTAFEAANPGVTIELVPIAAQETDYFTKLALMNGSADTAPDVIYEDTFQVRPDAAAEFLLPLDDYLAEWADWEQFPEGIREAGKGDDGSIYGVSMGTDTRGIYFNKEIDRVLDLRAVEVEGRLGLLGELGLARLVHVLSLFNHVFYRNDLGKEAGSGGTEVVDGHVFLPVVSDTELGEGSHQLRQCSITCKDRNDSQGSLGLDPSSAVEDFSASKSCPARSSRQIDLPTANAGFQHGRHQLASTSAQLSQRSSQMRHMVACSRR